MFYQYLKPILERYQYKYHEDLLHLSYFQMNPGSQTSTEARPAPLGSGKTYPPPPGPNLQTEKSNMTVMVQTFLFTIIQIKEDKG